MLKTIERIKILAGEPNPPGIDLGTLILQTAVNTAMDFIDNEKTTLGNDPATSYQNKVRGLAQKMLNNDDDTRDKVIRIWVNILGRTSATYTQVTNATITQWEGFANANMLSAFEYASNVTLEEKFEWDSI